MVSCCWILGGISRSDEGGAWSELRVQRVQPAAARGADRRGVRGSSEPAAQAHGCGWDGETVITSPDSHCERWCFKVRDRQEWNIIRIAAQDWILLSCCRSDCPDLNPAVYVRRPCLWFAVVSPDFQSIFPHVHQDYWHLKQSILCSTNNYLDCWYFQSSKSIYFCFYCLCLLDFFFFRQKGKSFPSRIILEGA